jgi:hypothetical protein
VTRPVKQPHLNKRKESKQNDYTDKLDEPNFDINPYKDKNKPAISLPEAVLAAQSKSVESHC